eukprot:3096049-Prymnesium_polylepis.1
MKPCFEAALSLPRLSLQCIVGVRTILRRTPATKIEPALELERAAAAAEVSGAVYTPASSPFFVHEALGMSTPPESTARAWPGHCVRTRFFARALRLTVSATLRRPERRIDEASVLCTVVTAAARVASGAAGEVPAFASSPVASDTCEQEIKHEAVVVRRSLRARAIIRCAIGVQRSLRARAIIRCAV